MKKNKAITASAPGKLLLMGDHAVVYGYPCIVTAINERMFSTVTRIDRAQLHINAPDVNVAGYTKLMTELGTGDVPKSVRFIEYAVKNFIEKYTISGGISVVTRSEFSSEFGFGSSSATVVSVLWALACCMEKQIDARELFDLAYKTVLDVQGVGSGFDVASAIFGGTLYYSKLGHVIDPISISEIPLVVGYSGSKADTTEMVKSVAKKRQENSQKVERIFSAISELVDDVKKKFEEGEWDRVGKLMDFNQEYLRDLGVSSQKLEDLIAGAKNAGAWGAKLSGAGGGDCMIAIAPSDTQQKVEEAITQAGGQVLRVFTNAEGVKVDTFEQEQTTDNQDEMLIVVNDKDEIVGYKTRAECHSNPNLLHRTVGVLLFDSQGRIVIQKRSLSKDMDAGLWGISAAGHVARGQTDIEAAHRELQEELGVDTSLQFVGTMIIRTPQESERATLFKGVYDGPFTINKQEVERVEIVDVHTIRNSKELVFTPAAKKALQIVGVLA